MCEEIKQLLAESDILAEKLARNVQRMGANRATHPIKYMDDDDHYIEA